MKPARVAGADLAAHRRGVDADHRQLGPSRGERERRPAVAGPDVEHEQSVFRQTRREIGDAGCAGPVRLAARVVGHVDIRELAVALARHQLVDRSRGGEPPWRRVLIEPAFDLGEGRVRSGIGHGGIVAHMKRGRPQAPRDSQAPMRAVALPTTTTTPSWSVVESSRSRERRRADRRGSRRRTRGRARAAPPSRAAASACPRGPRAARGRAGRAPAPRSIAGRRSPPRRRPAGTRRSPR